MWADEDAGETGDTSLLNTSRQTSSEDKRFQTITPVFIKHIQDLPENNKFFGQTLRLVGIVGVIKSMDYLSTSVSYVVEDFSGTIAVNEWIENSKSRKDVEVGSYYRITGSVRITDGVRSVMVVGINPLATFREMVTHYLETVAMRYDMEKFGKNAGNETMMRSAGDDNNYMNNTKLNLTKFQSDLFNAIRETKEFNGCTYDQLQQRFTNKIDEIRPALQVLIGEGYIYTTVNEDHFKATDV